MIMYKGNWIYCSVLVRFLLVVSLSSIFTLFTITLQAQPHEMALVENQAHKQQIVETNFHFALEALQKKNYPSAEGYLRRVLIDSNSFQEPSGRSAWYWMGFIFEQLDQPFEAIRIWEQGLVNLENCPVPDLFLMYHLARLYAENKLSDHEDHITRLSYYVFSHISPHQQPDLWCLLWDQTKCLLKSEELDQIQQLVSKPASGPGKLLFYGFRRHDPTPLSLQNEFLITFFQRSAKARKKFRDSLSPRGYDARGDLYVRLGEPFKILYDHSGTRGSVGYAIHPYEFWFYPNIHPEVFFTFVGKTSKADFRLENGPESVFGTFYRRHTFLFNRMDAGQTASFLRKEIYLTLAAAHESFRERLYQLNLQGSSSEMLNYALHHFPENDRQHAAYVDSILHSLVFGTDFSQQSIPLSISWYRFLADNGQIRLEFNYAVSLSDLYFQYSAPLYHTSIQSQIGVFDKNYELIDSDSLIERLEFPSLGITDERSIICQSTFQVNPGQHHILFRFDNPDGKKQQIFRADLQVEAFPETLLCLSDIQLATDIQPGKGNSRFNKQGLFVKTRLGNDVAINDPFFVYYEIYGLTKNQKVKTNYQIDYILNRPQMKKGIFGLFRKKSETEQEKAKIYQNHIQRTGENHNQVEYHKLDLTDLTEGNYQLNIKVTDLNSKQQVSSNIAIHFRK